MIYQPNHERTTLPSQLNTEPSKGVASHLASVSEQKPNYDGVTIEQMRGNPLYSQADDLDKIAVAQKQITENAKVLKSKGRFIRALNDQAQKMHKPKN